MFTFLKINQWVRSLFSLFSVNMSVASGLRSFGRLAPVKKLLLREENDLSLRFYRRNSMRDMPSELSYANGSSFPALTEGKLRLYSMRFCPYAQRTRLVLVHKNIRYETININLKAKPDWFFEKNPLGLVPALEQDGKIICESLVCNDYLDDVYTKIPLRPVDPYLRANEKMLIVRFDKILKLLERTLYGKASGTDLRQTWLAEFEVLEKNLDVKGVFFGGEKVAMLDFNLWPWFERLEIFEKLLGGEMDFIDKLPTKLSAWRRRMFQEPAVQATMFDSHQHTKFLTSLLQGQPDYDAGLQSHSKL